MKKWWDQKHLPRVHELCILSVDLTAAAVFKTHPHPQSTERLGFGVWIMIILPFELFPFVSISGWRCVTRVLVLVCVHFLTVLGSSWALTPFPSTKFTMYVYVCICNVYSFQVFYPTSFLPCHVISVYMGSFIISDIAIDLLHFQRFFQQAFSFPFIFS